MTEQDEKINASLHGHVLAKYNPYWKKAYNCPNLAKTLFDKCLEKNLKIYAITDDTYGNPTGISSRFDQIWADAMQLDGTGEVEMDNLGKDAFVLYNKENTIYFLNGQSFEITNNGRIHEAVTFGKSGLPNFNSFDEARNYLNGEGLISILEHPLATGHNGALTEDQLGELLENKSIDAIEFNSKIAVPNYLSWVPFLGGYSQKRNENAEATANLHEFPFVANDDSDTPEQIGIAYTIFPKFEIDFTTGETITQSLNTLILAQDFDIKTDHQDFWPWFAYALRAKFKGQ